MKRPFYALFLGAILLASSALYAQNPAWSEPKTPFRIYGNSWYVGTHGLSAILITSPQGHVLIDGTLPGNAGMIEANIRTLGFDLRDVRLILNSHAHDDHAGAIAALARDSGAQVRASHAGAQALMVGGDDPDDPQYSGAPTYPLVGQVAAVDDGETVHVGATAVTAHYTPGHTPGSTAWSWRACEQGQCLNLVYADSLTFFGHDGFRFGDEVAHPHRVQNIRAGLASLAALRCDILITPHPEASGFLGRVTERDRGTQPNPLIDPQACKRYAAKGVSNLELRLAKEQAER